jgi:hypothetical protein
MAVVPVESFYGARVGDWVDIDISVPHDEEIMAGGLGLLFYIEDERTVIIRNDQIQGHFHRVHVMKDGVVKLIVLQHQKCPNIDKQEAAKAVANWICEERLWWMFGNINGFAKKAYNNVKELSDAFSEFWGIMKSGGEEGGDKLQSLIEHAKEMTREIVRLIAHCPKKLHRRTEEHSKKAAPFDELPGDGGSPNKRTKRDDN